MLGRNAKVGKYGVTKLLEWEPGLSGEQIAKPLWRKQVFGIFEVEEKYHDLEYQLIKKKGDSIVKFPLSVEYKTREEYYWYEYSNEILFETRGNWLDRRYGYSYGSAIFDSRADVYAYAFNVKQELKSISFLWIKPLQKWLEKNRSLCKFGCSSTGNEYRTEFVTVDRNVIPKEIFFPMELIVDGYRFKNVWDELIEKLEYLALVISL